MPVDVTVASDLVIAMGLERPRIIQDLKSIDALIKENRSKLDGKRVQVMAKQDETEFWDLVTLVGRNGTYFTEDPHAGEYIREGRFASPPFCHPREEFVLEVEDSDPAYSFRQTRYYRIQAAHVHQIVEYPE